MRNDVSSVHQPNEAAMPPAAPRADWRWRAAGAALIVLGVLGVYWPALGGQFLWDDFLVVHRNPLVTGELGPWSLWFRTDFPLSTLAFWLEWRVWGEHTLGYHLVNVSLHAVSALLLWRVLAELRVRASWLAAMLFAVHPVCVGSVAWIAELKNTLSLPFFLLSVLWYVQAEAEPRTTHHAPRTYLKYGLSLLAFTLALLAKTSTVMLPAVLLGWAWWSRGRITWRDAWRTSPFLALALAFGLMTIRFQAQGAIGTATVQDESFWGRMAGAGMALWFYLGKALLPLGLSAVYPRWKIDAGAAMSYAPLALWCGGLAVCWLFRRRWGRHVLFALGCLTALLFPVLGFVDMFFLLLSRVSDHFAYLPMVAVVALVAAALDSVSARLGQASPPGPGRASLPSSPDFTAYLGLRGRSPSRQVSLAAAGALVLGLATLGNLRARVFVNEEALWWDTLAKNPKAWSAHANLGWMLAAQQKYDEAREHLVASLEVNPQNAQAHSNLGRVLALQGKFAEAEPHFQTALKIKPGDVEIRRAYASALAGQGRREEAVNQLREALKLRADTGSRLQLATLLYQTGRFAEAVAEYRQVLKAKPEEPEVLNNLAWLLATCPDDAVRNGEEAVRLAEQGCRLSSYGQVRPLGTLAAAYAEAGRFPEAVEMAQRAVGLARAAGNRQLAAMGSQLLEIFRAGKPYREGKAADGRRDGR